jgi:hypothetical protein
LARHSVPGASIKIINEKTGAIRQLHSDSQGNYQAIGFYLGTYEIEVAKTGFQKDIVPGVNVSPVTIKRIDVTLHVGSTTQTITVAGGAPVIQTVGPTINTNLNAVYYDKPIEDVSRSGWALSGAQWAPGGSSGASGIYLWNGFQGSETDLDSEGAKQQEGIALFVNPNSVQEVSIISGAPPAEYARPVTANITVKNGTNQLHGSVTVSDHNPGTDSVDTPFFQGAAPAATNEWRYEFTVGGPVYIPKVYNGRNKTFFFFDYWKPASTFVQKTVASTIPTMAMRSGDYSSFPVKPIDPLTGQPFPGAIIPSSRISPVATKIMNSFYAPFTYVGSANSFSDNANVPGYYGTSQDNTTIRIDQNFGTNNLLNFTYYRGLSDDIQNNVVSTAIADTVSNFPTAYDEALDNHRESLGYTHTFSSNLVSQSRGSVSRYIQQNTIVQNGVGNRTPVYGANILSQWGIQGITPLGLTGYPAVTIDNWNGIDVPNVSGTWYTDYQFTQDLTFVHNSHTIKGGISGLKSMQDSPFVPGFGSFTFNGQFTKEPFADFLLGLPGTFSRTSPRPWVAQRIWEYGIYGQDEWRVAPRLTLSYGLRWDDTTAPYDKNDEYFDFDLGTGQIVVPNQRALNNVSPAWNTKAIPVVLASSVGYPSKLTNPTRRFLPRFGFAYRPGSSDTFVIRGGYGVYQGNELFAGLQTGGPFAITQSFSNALVASAPQYAWPDAFPSGTGPIAGAATGASVSTNFRPEYNQAWNLSVEKQLWPRWGLRVSYIGNQSTQLAYEYNANTPLISTQPFSQSRRPFPQFQTITAVENGADSRYNALQVLLRHPFANGLDLQASYTEQRSTNDQGGGGPSGFTRDNTPQEIDYAYNRNRDYGNSGLWPWHEFDTTWAYNLPFGDGRRFGSGLQSQLGAAGWFVDRIISGWSTTGVFDWHSGLFFTPTYTGFDPGNIDQFSGRANVVPGCRIYTGNKLGATSPYINLNCFSVPANGTLGDGMINSLQGPNDWVLSLSPYKEFHIPHLGKRDAANRSQHL